MKYLLGACLLILLNCAPSLLLAQQETSATKAAIEFNDQLTVITDSLFARGQAWGRRFNEARKSRNYSSLKPYRQSLERFVDASISRVRNMKDVSNSGELRRAMVNFLEFEKRMLGEAFKPLEQLKPSASETEIRQKLKALEIYSASESEALAKVNIAQESYAKSNGFRIETKERIEKP